jgi:hypothetical protein
MTQDVPCLCRYYVVSRQVIYVPSKRGKNTLNDSPAVNKTKARLDYFTKQFMKTKNKKKVRNEGLQSTGDV